MRIKDGETLLGVLAGDNLKSETLRSMWGKPTLVQGVVHFKADGSPRFISTERMTESTSNRSTLERLPTAVADKSKLYSKGAKFKLSSLRGQWPGEETYEELIEILESMNRSGKDT